MLARNEPSGAERQPGKASILLQQTKNGVFRAFRMLIDSTVWGSTPLVKSITKTATSAVEPPLFLRLLNVSCPGVSMNSIPGTSIFSLNLSRSGPQISLIVFAGMKLAPIHCVIWPGSRAATEVPLIRSRSVVFPWSTWPSTTAMGWRMGIAGYPHLSGSARIIVINQTLIETGNYLSLDWGRRLMLPFSRFPHCQRHEWNLLLLTKRDLPELFQEAPPGGLSPPPYGAPCPQRWDHRVPSGQPGQKSRGPQVLGR